MRSQNRELATSASPRESLSIPAKLPAPMAEKEESEVCAVVSCGQPAARSLSAAKVKAVLPDLKLGDTGRRAHLCKTHYRAFRKKTKEERELDRAAW